MDEWFGELRWTNGQGLTGTLRVPSDQRAKLEEKPIRFRVGSDPIEVTWLDGTKDADGRTIVALQAVSVESLQSLTISVPSGLLDENQSLVGFLHFDHGEPATFIIPAGQERSFDQPKQELADTAAWSDFSSFFRLGIRHILEGTDHLLFLLCLLIAGGSLRHLVVVVTAFTVGHSITLALSVLGWLSLSSRLTESMIALSIVIAALSNLRLKPDQESGKTVLVRGLLAGGFGLVHGLGFASMLLSNGISGEGVALPLVGFNLGVEAGQVAAVLLVYPIIVAIHRSSARKAVVNGVSLLGALMGLFWFLERIS